MGQLIYFIKKELNWKERTIDAPKTFPIQHWEQGVTTPPNYMVALISRVMKNDGYISNDLSPVEIDLLDNYLKALFICSRNFSAMGVKV